MDHLTHGSTPLRALRCTSCSELIGVYERLVYVADGVAYETSRAAEPQLRRLHGHAYYHAGCYEPGVNAAEQ